MPRRNGKTARRPGASAHRHVPSSSVCSLLCYPASKALPGQDFELRLPGNDKEARRKAVQVQAGAEVLPAEEGVRPPLA